MRASRKSVSQMRGRDIGCSCHLALSAFSAVAQWTEQQITIKKNTQITAHAGTSPYYEGIP
jgi:hypothetical protein